MLKRPKTGVGLVIAAACLAIAASPRSASGAESFVRDNDVWAFLGDSITHADTYRRTLERVVQHYHPGVQARFVQGGKPGALATASKEQFQAAAAADRPTAVSLMTGMNNSINSDWRAGQAMDAPLEGYRRQLTEFARAGRANGVTVVLMSPTLTDESLGWYSMWALDGTAEFLRRCGRIAEEVARAEGAFYVPVAEEFEAVQRTLPPEQILRHDGVHPSALGQYAIARSLLRHMDFAGGLAGGARRMAEPAEKLPVDVSLQSRFLQNGDKEINLALTAEQPANVTATWSMGNARRSETLALAAGANTWTIKMPEPLNLDMGAASDIVIDVTDGKRMGLFIIDLCRTRVMHLQDGKVSGTVTGPATRPEGAKAADWTLSVLDGKALLFEADVYDSEIRTDHQWPWGQDGLQLWLDYRPTKRFADVGLDSDVYMLMLHPYEKPRFAVALRPWLGRGVYASAVAGGEKTPTGYRCRLSIADGEGQMRRFSKWQDSDLSKRDFLGFALVQTDLDTGPNGAPVSEYNLLHKTQYPHDKYGNTLIIVDLKGKLPGESAINAHITRLLP